MASLRLTFNGDRRPGTNCGERGRSPFYPFPRYQQRSSYSPFEPLYKEASPQTGSPGDLNEADPGPFQPAGDEVTNGDEVTDDEAVNSSQQEQGEEKDKSTVSVSEKFVNTMTVAETGLNSLRSQVEITKNMFDELIFKLDSGAQILDIIRSNEERRAAGPQVQAASAKTTKDTIDELLELLQTPMIQNMLRQLMLGWMTK